MPAEIKGRLSQEYCLQTGRVACPLHNWVIDLAVVKHGADEGCTASFETKVEDGLI